MSQEAFVLTIGFTAQACFFARFLWQWIVSERRGQCEIPVAFWYLSLVGGLLLLAYAIFRRDPVIILGQALGTFVYVRNLMLLHRSGRANREASSRTKSSVAPPHARPQSKPAHVSAR